MTTDGPQPEIIGPATGSKVTPASAETEYVVLVRGPEASWTDSATVKARSAEQAIRSVGKEGTFVAIPARSWKPVTVKAETTTVLKLEEAK